VNRSLAAAAQFIPGFLIAVTITVLVLEHSHSAAAPASIGTVKEIRSGTLERQERDLWKPLTAGMAISANDRVRTSAEGTSIVTLNDIGAVLIGPSTEYYLGDPSRGFKSLLKRGYIWISAKLSNGRTMSVATTNAVAGIRGTKFSVIQDGQGTDVCTCKGDVQVTTKDGKSMYVTSGMFSVINAKGKADKPAKGKPYLEKIGKEKPARYAPCFNCHKKGRKTSDLS